MVLLSFIWIFGLFMNDYISIYIYICIYIYIPSKCMCSVLLYFGFLFSSFLSSFFSFLLGLGKNFPKSLTAAYAGGQHFTIIHLIRSNSIFLSAGFLLYPYIATIASNEWIMLNSRKRASYPSLWLLNRVHPHFQ